MPREFVHRSRNELYNKHMKRLLDEYTDHYSTKRESKGSFQSCAEGTHLQYYMTDHNTPKYLDALPELADRYNQRIHSSIQMAPADGNNYNAEVVWERLSKPTVPLNLYRFQSEDFVRTTKLLKEKK